MQRIATSTAVAALPAPVATSTTPGFFAQYTPGVGAPTVMSPDWANGIQEELIAIILSGGLTPNQATLTQVRDAVMAIGYFADTGAANSYAIATSVSGMLGGLPFTVPAIAALKAGTRLLILAANTNAGASNLAVDGAPGLSWVNNAGGALGAGDILGGSIYPVMFDGAKIRMVGATNSQIAAMIAAATSTTPTVPMAGSAHTYANADTKEIIWRSNGGAPMTDLLPGNTAGALAAGWSTTIVNTDTSLMSIAVGPGSTLSGVGVFNGYIVLGAGQRVTVNCDGHNYNCYGGPERARLGTNTTLNVATTASGGSDTANVGITAGSSFATPQHAYNWAQASLDLAGFQLTITGAPGTTYTMAQTVFSGPLVGQSAPVILQGSGAASTTFGPCLVSNGANVQFAAATFISTTGGGGIDTLAASSAGSSVWIGAGVTFGPNAGTSVAHMGAFTGGQVIVTASYTIAGGAAGHFRAVGSGAGITVTAAGVTITLTGTPAFTSAFAVTQVACSINVPSAGVTFSGAATGIRYSVQSGSVINTNGGGASYFPGSVAGSGTGYF